MIGKTFFNGLDLFTAYGLYICFNGYNSLVQYPALKPVKTNDWPEEDGIEADLSNPVLDIKTVNILFAAAEAQNLNAFFSVLSESAYHHFEFREIRPGYYYELRFISQPEIILTPEGQYFKTGFQFSDDFPLKQYAYLPPNAGQPDTGWQLNGLDFGQYGIVALGNPINEIKKVPPVKERLVRKYENLPGIWDGFSSNSFTSDNGAVTYQAKEVTLDLLMRADSLAGFWRNYNAFLYDLKRPGERMLGIYGVSAQPHSFYYKRSSVSKFIPDATGAVWCEFSITLQFLSFNPTNN